MGKKKKKNPPSFNPEAQRSGKVGLICHNRSRSKRKDDPNIWPTALSFIAHCLALSECFPLGGFGHLKVAFDPRLIIVTFQPSEPHHDTNSRGKTQTKITKRCAPKLTYNITVNTDRV